MINLQSFSQPELIEALTHGLPVKLVREFADNLDLPLQDVAAFVRLNLRNLQPRFDQLGLRSWHRAKFWPIPYSK